MGHSRYIHRALLWAFARIRAFDRREISEMPFWQFQIANFSSAFVWAGTLLTIGDVITHILRWLW